MPSISTSTTSPAARKTGVAFLKPTPPGVNVTIDAELKRKQDEQAKQLDDTRKALATLPAAQRASMQAGLQSAEAAARSPQMVAMMRQQIEAERAQAQKTYQDDLKSWQDASIKYGNDQGFTMK